MHLKQRARKDAGVERLDDDSICFALSAIPISSSQLSPRRYLVVYSNPFFADKSLSPSLSLSLCRPAGRPSSFQFLIDGPKANIFRNARAGAGGQGI